MKGLASALSGNRQKLCMLAGFLGRFLVSALCQATKSLCWATAENTGAENRDARAPSEIF